MDNLYKKMLIESPCGFAYHKVIYDNRGTPSGYECIEMNAVFEQLTHPIDSKPLELNQLKEVSGEGEIDFDWRTHYKEIAQGETDRLFVLHSLEEKKYYKVRISSPEDGYIVTWATDITTEKSTAVQYEKLLKTYENVISGSNLGIWELNVQTGEEIINERWAEMIGYTKEELLPICEETWRGNIHPDDWERIQPTIKQGYEKGYGHYSIEFRMKHKDGSWVWINGRGKVNSWTTDGKPLLTSGTHADISALKRSEEEMLYLSYHDPLTKLYNRRFYEEELARLDVERNLPIALIMADVNGLKLVNDAFGHEKGDHLLRTIAKIIKEKCRSDEIVSRIGGDEFIILLPKTNEDEAKQLINRIHSAVEKRGEKNSIMSISLGYAVKVHTNERMQDVFKCAEDDMYRHKLSERLSMRSKSIDLIMNSLYEKSNREMHHSKRVGDICELIASHMYYSQAEVKQIKLAGLVHDIGKIGISNAILDKDGPLTIEEYCEIQKHSEAGHRILSSVGEFSEIAEYVLAHQERWDGSGYPQSLKGEEIPIQARMIAIADAYDAMTADRTYRRKIKSEVAIEEIKKCAGTQFDPEIVRIFTEKVIKELED
jgi:diguanylate cyclase (GGDEF)-like protein/PAS domain S-box-containing protein